MEMQKVEAAESGFAVMDADELFEVNGGKTTVTTTIKGDLHVQWTYTDPDNRNKNEITGDFSAERTQTDEREGDSDSENRGSDGPSELNNSNPGSSGSGHSGGSGGHGGKN
jgi:hypothetical protein